MSASASAGAWPRSPVGVIGEQVDLTYDHDYLGAGPDTLAEIVSGKHPFAETLKNAERPLIIVGQGALTRPDGAAVLALAAKAAQSVGAVSEDWNGFCVLHTAASRVGSLDLGFVPGEGGLDAKAMARGARSTCSSCSEPTRSRSHPAPSSSIRARTAIAGRTAPT
jgi:NADH dehydrogenase/NADH:ubiquinone oxidoreductase subunit G